MPNSPPLPFAPFPPEHPVNRTPAIWHPATPRDAYAHVLFRRGFALAKPGARGGLLITACQRFVVYLDGELIARGPARSDPQRWHVTEVTLPRLSAGTHALAVHVANFDRHAGIGQMGGPAFLLVVGTGILAGAVETGTGWRCTPDLSRTPAGEHAWAGMQPYFVVGTGEHFHAQHVIPNWMHPHFDDSAWAEARIVCPHAADPWGNMPLGHILRPDPLPAMEETRVAFARLADAPADLRADAAAFAAGRSALLIPSHRDVRLVLDRGHMTNAYPTLTFSRGRDARVQIVSAEAPYLPHSRDKTLRDDLAGKQFLGFRDVISPDGGNDRAWTPLWFRSFRYLELTIRTADEPLRLEALALTATGYPLRDRARFRAPGPLAADYARLWDTSLRTIALCAHETFFDCPHYEQAQFPGDTRVQALYHYLVANDDRLARKAIDDFWASRLPDGLTQCRYPSRQLQILPTFSLYWVAMLHDFLRYRGDAAFLAPYLPAARAVLAWFLTHQRPDGLLGPIPYAPFIDWTPAFPCGNAPQDADGGSSILTLLLATTARQLADLERAAGFSELAPRWTRLHKQLAAAVRKHCWDPRRQLLADTSSKKTFSQHAQAKAVLAGALPAAAARRLLTRALADTSLAPPGTFYYRYYIAQALKAAGLREGFFNLLHPYQQILAETHLTTWPETDKNARSDCHAWSVMPAIELLQTVLGIEPAAPGFAAATLTPTLGPLGAATGSVQTPHGPITVSLERTAAHTAATLDTPVPITIPSLRRTLKPGKHTVRWPA